MRPRPTNRQSCCRGCQTQRRLHAGLSAHRRQEIAGKRVACRRRIHRRNLVSRPEVGQIVRGDVLIKCPLRPASKQNFTLRVNRPQSCHQFHRFVRLLIRQQPGLCFIQNKQINRAQISVQQCRIDRRRIKNKFQTQGTCPFDSISQIGCFVLQQHPISWLQRSQPSLNLLNGYFCIAAGTNNNAILAMCVNLNYRMPIRRVTLTQKTDIYPCLSKRVP